MNLSVGKDRENINRPNSNNYLFIRWISKRCDVGWTWENLHPITIQDSRFQPRESDSYHVAHTYLVFYLPHRVPISVLSTSLRTPAFIMFRNAFSAASRPLLAQSVRNILSAHQFSSWGGCWRGPMPQTFLVASLVLPTGYVLSFYRIQNSHKCA